MKGKNSVSNFRAEVTKLGSGGLILSWRKEG
jgi:hypothetical protein